MSALSCSGPTTLNRYHFLAFDPTMEQSSISPVNSENLSFSVLRMEIFSNVQIQRKKKCNNWELFGFRASRREKEKKGEGGKERERRWGRDCFFKTLILKLFHFSLKGQTLGTVFIWWVCTLRLKTLWKEFRGRNLWLGLGWATYRPRNTNSVHHILTFLDDLAKSDYGVEKTNLFPASLQNFDEIQMLKNETAASEHLGSNQKLLTPTIPRTSLESTTKIEAVKESSQHGWYIECTSNSHSNLSSVSEILIFSF